jgi:RND family efflux transporter MFP subunit
MRISVPETSLAVPLSRCRRVQMALWVCSCQILCISLGCGQTAPPAEEKAPPATVKWEGPVQGALEEWTELIGTTTPVNDRVARVTAPVEGRVQSIFSDASSQPIVEGQRVEKGAVLVQLDPTVVQAGLAKAEAAQEVLKEERQQAVLAVQSATNEVERLRQLELDAKSPGGTRSLVSPTDKLKADIALKEAQSKLAAANFRLNVGDFEQKSLNATLRLHTLTAPIAGRVGRILVVRGQTLSIGTPVADVVDLDEQIDVLCFVPPSLVGKLKLGQQARSGGFDSGTTAMVEAEGEIVFIAEQAESETGNFAVKVRFSNKEVHLRANRVLRIRVLTTPGKECLNIRESAVQEDDEQPTIVIVTDVKTGTNVDGKEETTGIARRMKVVLGLRDRTLHQIEIVRLEDPEKDPAKRWSGEVKDALFVVEGGHGLQTGDPVKLEVEVD